MLAHPPQDGSMKIKQGACRRRMARLVPHLTSHTYRVGPNLRVLQRTRLAGVSLWRMLPHQAEASIRFGVAYQKAKFVQTTTQPSLPRSTLVWYPSHE
jgi:hypothetical protein